MSAHQYYPSITFVLLLMTICFLVGAQIKKRHFHYFPETAATVTIGIISGFIFVAAGVLKDGKVNIPEVPPVDGEVATQVVDTFTGILVNSVGSFSDQSGTTDAATGTIRLSANFFYLVLLPPIIFEAGYAMKRVNFFKNLQSILSLAFLGTALSAFVTGIIIYLLSQSCSFSVSFLEALVYGCLISATDPVSVLATLQEVPIDKNLYILVFGESALNDAVAIIMYKFVGSFAEATEAVNAATVVLTTLLAIGVFAGSVALGYLVGMVLAKILKHSPLSEMEDMWAVEVVMVFSTAYISYLMADWLSLSGIVSILFCGMSMAHYVIDNLSDEAAEMSKKLLRVYALFAETVIFIYLGLALAAFSGMETLYKPDFIAISIFAMLVSRAHVFLLCFISNIWRKKKIPFAQQIFLWYAGLRGALCFVMALELGENQNFRSDYSRAILATTLVTVVFTIIIQGAWTMSILKGMGLEMTPQQIAQADQEEQREREEKQKNRGSSEEGSGFFSRLSAIRQLDKRFLKPFLTNRKFGEQRLEAYLQSEGEMAKTSITGSKDPKYKKKTADNFDGDLEEDVMLQDVGSNTNNNTLQAVQLSVMTPGSKLQHANDLDY